MLFDWIKFLGLSVVVFASFITIGLSQSQVPTTLCPDLNTKVAVPEDCTSYYQCTTLGLTPEMCPQGTYYDCSTQKCGNLADISCCPQDPKKQEYPQTKIGLLDSALDEFRDLI